MGKILLFILVKPMTPKNMPDSESLIIGLALSMMVLSRKKIIN
jgi:hypothetical protein